MKYYKIFKPYGVLSQFTDNEGRQTLSSLFNFPKDVYPVGRLDYDSEGLLLLTDDKRLTDHLLNPKNKHEREYNVLVEGIPQKKDLDSFSKGLIIQGYKTLPAEANIIKEPVLPERSKPIRERKNIPVTWLAVKMKEGKNRQVRKMTAAIGFPTLRLVRVRIKNVKVDNMKSGEVKELSKKEISELLK